MKREWIYHGRALNITVLLIDFCTFIRYAQLIRMYCTQYMNVPFVLRGINHFQMFNSCKYDETRDIFDYDQVFVLFLVVLKQAS